jgi:hypothetical protein
MNESQNNNSNRNKQKWIALGVVGFLAISGGIYLLSKPRGVSPQGQGLETAEQSGDTTTTPSSETTDTAQATGGSGASPDGAATTGADATGSMQPADAGATGTAEGQPTVAADGATGSQPGAPSELGQPAHQGTHSATQGAMPSATGTTAGAVGLATGATALQGGKPGLTMHGPANAPASSAVAKGAAHGGVGAALPGAPVGAPGLPAGGVPLVGAPSLPSLPGAGKSGGPATGQVVIPAAPPAPVYDQCITVTYAHKPSGSHPDEESCSHHKNMLKIPELEGKKIADGSLCVRVNGVPVHYLTVKKRPDELIFGAVAGPKSKVTVRYCTGLAKGCAIEKCEIPKDEFMDAIGGGDGNKGQNPKLGQWDPTGPAQKEADVMAKLDATVKRELETNNELNGRAPAGALYKDWIGSTETAACGGSTQAKN